MKSKKAQGWGFDVLFASMIFVTAIVTFYVYSLNNSGETESAFNSMQYDGNIITDMILSEGFPANWNTSNVLSLGLMSDNKINETKLAMFYNISRDDYPRTTAIFHTKYNYFLNFSQPINTADIPADGFGKPISSTTNLIKISRLTIYNNKAVTLNIFIFQ